VSRSFDVPAVATAQQLAFAAGSAITQSLHVIGWELLSVEIDAIAETLRIELHSGERYVMFDARNGRASITSELMTVESHRTGRKGDIAVAHRIRPMFLGRQNGLGLRSGLRALSHYVADNAPLSISHEQARSIFRPLLSALVQPTSHGAGVSGE